MHDEMTLAKARSVLGRHNGRIGGQARTEKKRIASIENLRKANAARLSKTKTKKP